MILIDRKRAVVGSSKGGGGAASLSCFIQIYLTFIYLIFTRYVIM